MLEQGLDALQATYWISYIVGTPLTISYGPQFIRKISFVQVFIVKSAL